MSPKTFKKMADAFPSTRKMPVLFFGHGSPMNIIEDNAFSRAWRSLGEKLERPSAVLCISAHWFVDGTYVHGAERPRTIHDFYGFPQALYALHYECPGSPEGAKEAQRTVKGVEVGWDEQWGLDHGAWMVLHHLFPRADVPVFQMSIDHTKPPSFHYALAKELASLRRKGVLIIASGNIVHNLGIIEPDPDAAPFDWAESFDRKVKTLILDRDHRSLIEYPKLGEEALLSVPTPDHYLPLLSALALQEEDEELSFFVEGIVHGSVGMRGLIIGKQ